MNAFMADSLTIRPAVADDIESMRTLLNEIIRVGGTTAITNELSPDEMCDWFISGATLFRVLWRLILMGLSPAFSR